MSVPLLKRYGPLAVLDSGAPDSTRHYTTLIIFHGLGFHSATMKRLLPLATDRNTRVVAVNRPGYPGSEPVSQEELAHLHDITERSTHNPQSAAEDLLDYFRSDAEKLHTFLVEYIRQESITVEGGIILAGWSLGGVAMLELLAYAHNFSSKEVDVRSYIKHVVFYDIPACCLGYAPPPNIVSILLDPSITPGEALKLFPKWISSYYAHSEDLSKVDDHGLNDPQPTLLAMDPSEVQEILDVTPTLPGGFDERCIQLGIKLGVYAQLKDSVMYPRPDDKMSSEFGNKWNDIPINHVWCDQSMWEMPWATVRLQANLEAAKNAGRATRKVNTTRLRGVNHFCHWDQPEVALQGLLSSV